MTTGMSIIKALFPAHMVFMTTGMLQEQVVLLPSMREFCKTYIDEIRDERFQESKTIKHLDTTQVFIGPHQLTVLKEPLKSLISRIPSMVCIYSSNPLK